MGVRIDSKDNVINSIQGRTTTLLPNNACLFCRGRISSETISAQIMQETNPEEAEILRREGYIPELPGNSPAVIPFTTIVSSTSVLELLHRLTGFLGSDRVTSEVNHLFDMERISKNNRTPEPDCICKNTEFIGRGDTYPNLLGQIWRDEN